MYMKLKDGKSKVLTFSYDDGVVQDIRFIKILNEYGLKGTFNINTGRYLPEDAVRETFRGKLKLSEMKELYAGHEVAVHTVNHTFLDRLRTTDILVEVMEDRKNIEAQYRTIARGMAYPYGRYNDEVVEALEKCGICYARTAVSTGKFTFPENWLTLHPTCHHKNPKLMDYARQFAETNSRYTSENRMFYVWGHTYEFDDQDNWEIIEEFAKYIGNREDIWYATNIEIYDYVKAYENLQVSMDGTIVHNPSAIDVWFVKDTAIDAPTYCVKAGETVFL